MSHAVHRTQALQPMQIERQRFDNIDHWPARQHCVFRHCHFKQLHLDNERLSALRFENCELGEVQLDRCHLDQVVFDRCTVQGLRMQGGAWTGLSWYHCQLGPWTLQQVALNDLQVIGGRSAALAFVDVSGRHGTWADCELQGFDVRGGTWHDLTLAHVRGSVVGLAGARLERLLWGQCQIGTASLSDCAVKTLTWFDCLLGRVQMSHVLADHASWQDSVIASGRLDHCAMPMALLARCHLKAMTWSACDLTQALLDGARLDDCDLRALHAPRSSLRGTRLTNVNLSGADLTGLNATGAQVSGLRLTGARCGDGTLHGQHPADWAGADLDGAEFSIDPSMDDSLWWLEKRPGPRKGALN